MRQFAGLAAILLLSGHSLHAAEPNNDNSSSIALPAQVKPEVVTVKKAEQPDYSISIVSKKSMEFPLGEETRINMRFVAGDNPAMWLQAGVRVQGTFEKLTSEASLGASERLDDAYLRRVRFEVGVGFDEHTSFIMDIRNDQANFRDKGEGDFNVGDAYIKISKPFGSSLANFKLYRAKIDVSRTETAKSARTIHYDRAMVADEAAQFISHNRRAANLQMYGDWNKKIHYQVAIGDGVQSDKVKDASGSSLDGSLEQKSFFFGGKLRFSPIEGWEETARTETYFGKGQHASIGIGYWTSPDIVYDNGQGVAQSIDHTLINYELSAHYQGAFIQAEYFDFNGVVRDWSAADVGESEGWYVLTEYTFKDWNFLAPFYRYENWDRYSSEAGYQVKSQVFGANWYLRGNTTKVGLAIQNDKYEVNVGDRKDQRIKLTSQWFF